VDPTDAWNLALLGVCLSRTAQHTKATSKVAQAVALAPLNPDVLISASLVYLRAGDEVTARDKLRAALSIGGPGASAMEDELAPLVKALQSTNQTLNERTSK
jgi:Flp pilus assembly protein TadD